MEVLEQKEREAYGVKLVTLYMPIPLLNKIDNSRERVSRTKYIISVLDEHEKYVQA